MRRTTSTLVVVTAIGIAGCMGSDREPVEAQPSSTAGMEIEDQQAMDDRAREMREEYREPRPQYGELEHEPSMEPETYGEMQRQPGEMDPMMPGEAPSAWEQQSGSSGDLAMRIDEALNANPSLQDDAIVVRIEGSRVHLAGLVDSPTEVSTARDVVSSIPGVQEVDIEQLRVVTQR